MDIETGQAQGLKVQNSGMKTSEFADFEKRWLTLQLTVISSAQGLAGVVNEEINRGNSLSEHMEIVEETLSLKPSILPYFLKCLYEMTFCRLVDYFNLYVSELVARISAVSAPNTVNSGGRRGARDFWKELKKHLRSVEWLQRQSGLDIAFDMIELRNVFTHACGAVDHKSTQMFVFGKLSSGSLVFMDSNFLEVAFKILYWIALLYDGAAIDCFGLETVNTEMSVGPITTWRELMAGTVAIPWRST